MKPSTTILVSKKRGRPKTGIGQQVQVRLDAESLARLDAYAAEIEQKRPEAIRRIVRDFLSSPRKP